MHQKLEFAVDLKGNVVDDENINHMRCTEKLKHKCQEAHLKSLLVTLKLS